MKKNRFLIKNAQLINEGQITQADLLIEGNKIGKIGTSISFDSSNTKTIDGSGQYILPGLIDDQVHFREPGLTHKADIASESKAALAGGITSFIEMPNTLPQTTSLELLEQKFEIARKTAYANYSFMFGGTNDNLSEILKLDHRKVAALKLFLGSSTGNMLVDDPKVLKQIFSKTPLLIAVHCEDEKTIAQNFERYKKRYGNNIPVSCHPKIRTEEACFLSSSKAIELAKKTGARLHVFHLSTGKETQLFDNTLPLKDKKITAEVCVHHLWFSDADYTAKGSLIKWNPAIKTEKDRRQLWEALLDDRIDVIATDHAPHIYEEKIKAYTQAPSGGPLVQHALPALMEKVKQGVISLPKLVEKACHNPATLFQVEKRGYIKEGYFADLVLLHPNSPWTVDKTNVLYKCKWSPFEGQTFSSRVTHTFLNGTLAYRDFGVFGKRAAQRLSFNR